MPLNYKDPSIPCGFFDIALHIMTNQTVTYTINLSLTNPMQDHKRNYRYEKNDKIQLIKLFSRSHDFSAPDFGDLSIATDTEDVSYQEYCTSAAGSIIWRFFGRTSPKRPNLRTVLTTRPQQKGNGGDVCSLAAHFALKPGEKKSIRFVIAWS
ncbi:GH116 family glycosyl-hydrolase [Paenibacillus sp. MDMC362]|uniref:GH116 family glycosyl-hydrolase n=1 Tax=Paenibacillus sp. MDMC362 TaxID=2977365 RepID=UPI000DC603A7|nr:GH116 family glycosyl-hydrolase [Paenibacillus sp. MDMC362]RAR41015.1 hypothetical protein DP091_25835 [Paenibacillus sp. MDMC362]